MPTEPPRPYHKPSLLRRAIKQIMCNGQAVILKPTVTKPSKSSASKQIINQ